jgi:hypothetical protein
MVALPNELGEMESLRLLDLRNCYKLKQIPQNVIQRLSRLEELIMNFIASRIGMLKGQATLTYQN